MPKLLVIDDEAAICELIADIAEGAGYSAGMALTADAFFTAYDRDAPDVVVIDLLLSGTDGVELLRSLATRSSAAKVIVISGVDAKVLATAERLGEQYGLHMVGALTKPIEVGDLIGILERIASDRGDVSSDHLAAAIENDEMEVHFQPKMDLLTGETPRLCGAEALVRWNRPGEGLVLPGKFIQIVEESDLVRPLTDVVVRQSLELVQRLPEQAGPMSIAVNVPAQMLHDLDLPDRLAGAAAAHDVDPDRIIVEITERAAMEDNRTVADILTRFRLKGIGLSLDDFGTGYSSLVDLYRMPFSELKVDRSFVVDLESNEEARTIVAALIGLAHNLGLTVCAEGVESQPALDFLVGEGCDKAQGYLFSKPISKEEFIAFASGGAGSDQTNVSAPRREAFAS